MVDGPAAPGVESYEIGPKINRLRKKKELSLVKLGEHTGTSASLISKIERGLLIPTIPTLMRIATVFGVGLEHFFAGEPGRGRVAVVRRKDRLRLPNRTDGLAPTFLFESLDFPVTDRKMDAYLATFELGAAATDPHRHAGVEFIYITQGALMVTIDNDTIVLDEGDSVYFDSSVPHSYCQKGKRRCTAVVVVST